MAIVQQSKGIVSPLFSVQISCIFPAGLGMNTQGLVMIRKYWWLVIFAVFVFLFDALLIQWIELMTTEHDKCRNMNSVNPLKLVNCVDLE